MEGGGPFVALPDRTRPLLSAMTKAADATRETTDSAWTSSTASNRNKPTSTTATTRGTVANAHARPSPALRFQTARAEGVRSLIARHPAQGGEFDGWLAVALASRLHDLGVVHFFPTSYPGETAHLTAARHRRIGAACREDAYCQPLRADESGRTTSGLPRAL